MADLHQAHEPALQLGCQQMATRIEGIIVDAMASEEEPRETLRRLLLIVEEARHAPR